MIPGSKADKKKYSIETRFDTRRRRRVNMSGPYIGDQAKLLGSHGGRSLVFDFADYEKNRKLRKIAEAELKEEMVHLDLSDDLSIYHEEESREEEENNLTENDFTYGDLDYDPVDYLDF